MENNGLVLGRIPVSAPGCKTYPESILDELPYSEFDLHKTYYLDEKGKISKNPYGKELVILSVLPYGNYSDKFCEYRFRYIVEFIEKDILYQHLIDERMIIEEQLKGNDRSLSLK